MKKLTPIFFILFFIGLGANAQNGSIKGRVYNSINNEPIAFATVIIDSTTMGASTDINGNYIIQNVTPKTYNISCASLGFKKQLETEISVSSNKPTTVNFGLIETANSLTTIEIKASPYTQQEESPVSLRTISAEEIYRSPGANRDISKVIQILPGVASSVSFRNDLIVRGGSPNENRFFLDGIEIPNINHFATQGSSGGPVGMLNVNFIREVDFYSGAFPSNRGNALSAVVDFKQLEGNTEKLSGTFALGSSDVGLTLDGPMGKKSTFFISARRSYLQFLFKALNLPFLPTYNDFQYKQVVSINQKNKLTLIGLGAIDDFELNSSVNKNLDDPEDIRRNNYVLGNLPINTQWNYAIGANWQHFSENSFQNIIFSRNHLNNKAIKYQNNIDLPENLLLDYKSEEIENKFRFEHTYRKKGWKWNAGAGYEHAQYSNTTFQKVESNGSIIDLNFESELPLNKFALFTQVSKTLLKERLTLSGGLRSDFNDYSQNMNTPLKQISPRLSASYALAPKWNVNFNIGRFYQLPSYTVLGYRDSIGELINKTNGLRYIQADHFVVGLEYNPTKLAKITLEGFYKLYEKYPFLLNDSISLANLGGDFGVIGNAPVSSTSKGRSYGVELLMQQKLSSSIYGILSYTFVRSEFTNGSEKYVPSSWDNRHILNITAGKKLKKNWEIGLRFRLLGGAPYTPYDRELSATKNVWDATKRGIFDWDRLNEERNPITHGLDIRIDKKWFFKKWSLNAYLDIQNLYNFKTESQPFLDIDTDTNGNPITDPNNAQAYSLSEIENTTGTVLPSVGLMISF